MNETKRGILLLGVVALLIALRFGAESQGIYEFQPYYALFFCLAFWRGGKWLAIPAIAYLISLSMMSGGLALWMVSPILGFALIALWGRQFHESASKLSLFGGSLIGASIFYVQTNIFAFLFDGRYEKSLGGLAQALWTGLPADAVPTWFFLRNALIATSLFTAVLLIFIKSPEKTQRDEVPAMA
ncbi:MAG: hypothetical protein Q7Q71_11670 [Verrucomicrobiota bacterium JB023]|nr:hypothetical protein [Verrucomicrobiota bacterium JB023]